MAATDEMVRSSERYSEQFEMGHLALPPAKRVAVLACMDARLNPYALLGLSEGDAHIIRNAGGVLTDDAVRSLAISQHLLGTEEIVLIHHTDCGMLTFTDEDFKSRLQESAGVRPEWPVHTFSDIEGDLRDAMQRIKLSPFIPKTDKVRGFVYEVETGKLREVG
jgi:carbonic anhydrase